MRLIDADKQEPIIEELENICENNEYVLELLSQLKNQPTVFDLDKVIAELEKKQLEIKDNLLLAVDEEFATMLRGKLSQIANDIEILRKENEIYD